MSEQLHENGQPVSVESTGGSAIVPQEEVMNAFTQKLALFQIRGKRVTRRILFGQKVTAWVDEPRLAIIWRRNFAPHSARAYAIEIQIGRTGRAFGVVWLSKPNTRSEPTARAAP